MSGGTFTQYHHLTHFADKLDNLVLTNPNGYSPETLSALSSIAAKSIMFAQVILEVDLLVSGDQNEYSFNKSIKVLCHE